jgi:hypothetical protein
MTYVELHLTFMSRSRFTGCSLLRHWVCLKSSFRCAEEQAYILTKSVPVEPEQRKYDTYLYADSPNNPYLVTLVSR